MPGRARCARGGRRLRRRPARLRAGRRPQALEGRARPSAARRASAAHRHLVEFRGASELQRRRDASPSRRSSRATEIKVSGTSIGKGFQGTIKRHNFSRGPVTHGSHNVRKPGSIGASATPVARLQGQEDGGPHGRAPRHPARVSSSTRWTPSGTCCSSAAPFRARRAGSSRSGSRSSADGRQGSTCSAARRKDVALDAAVFEAEVKPHLVHETVRAELNARRARHARREEPRARLRRPREAVAPEGHRPRPPGHDPRAAVHGRRRRLRARRCAAST